MREGSFRARAANRGQAAVVEAMSRALGNFSREVADAIRRLPRPKHPPREAESV